MMDKIEMVKLLKVLEADIEGFSLACLDVRYCTGEKPRSLLHHLKKSGLVKKGLVIKEPFIELSYQIYVLTEYGKSEVKKAILKKEINDDNFNYVEDIEYKEVQNDNTRASRG